MKPKVTVLMAVYNGGDYVRAAVESVLAQTYADFELLIVDDASTDGGIERALIGLDDSRVRVICNDENIGQVPSLNRGLREAVGEHVARLDHDDICEPDRLTAQVAALEGNPHVAVVGAWATLIDDDDRSFGVSRGRVSDRVDFVYWTLLQHLLIVHPAAMFRRDVVLALGGYDETMGPAEDKDLWRRVLLAGHDARILPEPLVRYRVHDAQLSQMRFGLQRANDDRSQELLLRRLAGADAPVRQLRLLLAGDVSVWAELGPAVDLRPWLDRLILGTIAYLGLGATDGARLSARLHRRVHHVVFAGWRANGQGWNEQAQQLLDWSGAGGSFRLRAIRAVAPTLRPIDRATGLAVQAVAQLELLDGLRVRLRRSPLTRRVYSAVIRSRHG